MKKKLLIGLLLVMPLTIVSAKGNVTSLNAEYDNGKITYSGNTDSDVTAISCFLYDESEKEIDFNSSAVDNGKYEDTFTVSKGKYTVKCASYEGGTILSKEVTTSKVVIVAKENTEEDNKAKEEVAKIVNKIANNETVEGVSKELKNAIISAINDGKTISVDVAEEVKKEEEVSLDAALIKEKASDYKIAGYYDVTVKVSIDGVYKGNITLLSDGIDLYFELTDELINTDKDVKRTYKVAKVHDDAVEILDAELNGKTLKTSSKEFSTYAIIYKDTKVEEETKVSTPNTLDNIKNSIILGSSALLIGGITLVLLRKKIKN